MNSTDQIRVFVSMFTMQLPTLMVCLVSVVVILTKGRQASGGALWGLLGFGLALMLCFAMPVGQTLLQHWVFESGERASRMWAFSVSAIFGSVLHAVVYVFLLVAILAGRLARGAAIPSSLNHRGESL